MSVTYNTLQLIDEFCLWHNEISQDEREYVVERLEVTK